MAGSSQPLKLGIIGCGEVTEYKHLLVLRDIPRIEVAALADINEVTVRRVADRFHIARRYTDYRAILDDPAIEAVAVCVPAHSHIEVALAALDTGKHIFIEKPLALGLNECGQL